MIRDIRNYKLDEGVSSPVIFHFTRMQNLCGILTKNVFTLTAGYATPSDNKFNRGYSFYMSCCTNKSPRVGFAMTREVDNVCLTLDGTKLSHNYKFIPVEYWEISDATTRWQSKSMDEMEDRIVSNKPTIPDFTDYITRVDIFHVTEPSNLHKLAMESCMKRNIEFHMYEGTDEKSKEIDLDTEYVDDGEFIYGGHYNPEGRVCSFVTALMCAGRSEDEVKMFRERYISLFKFEDSSHFDSAYEYWVRDLKSRGMSSGDYANDFRGVVGYVRTTRNVAIRTAIHDLSTDMSHYKCKGDPANYMLCKEMFYKHPSTYTIYHKLKPLVKKILDRNVKNYEVSTYYYNKGETTPGLGDLCHDFIYGYFYECCAGFVHWLVMCNIPNDINMKEAKDMVSERFYSGKTTGQAAAHICMKLADDVDLYESDNLRSMIERTTKDVMYTVISAWEKEIERTE